MRVNCTYRPTLTNGVYFPEDGRFTLHGIAHTELLSSLKSATSRSQDVGGGCLLFRRLLLHLDAVEVYDIVHL